MAAAAERAAGRHAAADRLRHAGRRRRRRWRPRETGAGGRGRAGETARTAKPRAPQPVLPDLVDSVAETLAALRRKGFGRLYVDGADGDARRRRPGDAAGSADAAGDRRSPQGRRRPAGAADRLDRDRLHRRRRRRVRHRAADGASRSSTASPSASSAATCNIQYEVPQPRLFSFNNPFGACPLCHGFGNIIELDMAWSCPTRLEVDPAERDRAVEQAALPRAARRAEARRARGGVRLDVPWSELDDDEKRFVIEGDGGGCEGRQGLLPLARAQEVQGPRPRVPEPLSRLPDLPGVPAARGCGARRATSGSASAPSTSSAALTVQEADRFFASWRCRRRTPSIADKVLREIRKRLGFLRDVGLDYLTLDRLSSTLSGGESQRINLATSLGSALVDTLYVLDEPSIGLHSRDNERLITILRKLRDQGNTVLVVEHDADMIRVADIVVDMGLGAGEQGGRVDLLGHARAAAAGAALADREVPARRAGDPGAGDAPQADQPEAAGARRVRAQPQEHRRRDPARHADLRHRRQRLGQEHARARRDLRRAEAREGRLGSPRRHAPQARRRRVRHRRGARRPGADRPHAAIEPGDLPEGVRSDPRAVRVDQGRAGRAASPPATSRSTCPGGRCEACEGEGRGQGRDAVPRRRVRAVRVSARASASSRRCSRSSTAAATSIRCST